MKWLFGKNEIFMFFLSYRHSCKDLFKEEVGQESIKK